MNVAQFIGRLATQPEIRYTQKQDAVANFRIAVDRKFKKEGQPDCDFFNCTAFGKTAEFIEKYINKGMKVGIVSHIQNDQYTDREGIKRTSTNVYIDSIEFCEKKEMTEIDKEQQRAAEDFMKYEDDMPFNF